MHCNENGFRHNGLTGASNYPKLSEATDTTVWETVTNCLSKWFHATAHRHLVPSPMTASVIFSTRRLQICQVSVSCFPCGSLRFVKKETKGDNSRRNRDGAKKSGGARDISRMICLDMRNKLITSVPEGLPDLSLSLSLSL